jgi:hydrocephalus-inducing protein
MLLQVSDADNIMGLLHTEVITIHAEAYDVALDVSFPKGREDTFLAFYKSFS